MDTLPNEMLAKLLLCLNPVDRLKCALTCRRWARAVTAPQLLHDVKLVLRGPYIEAAQPVLMMNHRKYRNLKIVEGFLDALDTEFWSRIGRNLRDLRLIRCEWSIEDFFSIFQRCKKVEFLKVSAQYSNLAPDSLEIPTHMSSALIRKSMCNVRHLRLKCLPGNPLLEGNFSRLLALMPQIASISIYFSFQDDLAFSNTLHNLLQSNVKPTELDLSFASLEDEDIIKIVRKYSGVLQRLRLSDCPELSHEAFVALGTCSKLRRLELLGAILEDDDVKELLRHASELEHLDISAYKRLTRPSLTHIKNLTKLRHVGLLHCIDLDSEFLRDLCTVSALRRLDLTYSDDALAVLQSLSPVRNLQSLSLACNHVDSESIDIIIECFKQLTYLELDCCRRLTDADGIKFRRLENLTTLKLWDAYLLTDVTFENGVGSEYMEELALGGCSLTAAGLASIAAHHDRLKKFVLHQCHTATDAGLTYLFRSEAYLQKIDFISCDLISDALLESLATLCPHLNTIGLENCNVSELALQTFSDLRPAVEVF
ncbi:F-box/LRR-repeat protein 3 [Galendromus occidentalis]|uniref:F-box/LRR-repeat protein 3 n=1 Tax=Galendromus occidentalis TaxID=34638 RepID=A0AAJ6QUT6_9ACAR|nr:F-box/LRR-repeat protein 3 [Galendromus occidentalis]